MDFIYRLKDSVNESLDLPIPLRTGYLGAGETLVIYPLPGSTTQREYMDGMRDVNLNYEIAMKSQDGMRLEQSLWQIADYLDSLMDVQSQDGSFEFNRLTITSKPFIEQIDEQGWMVFLINFTASITTMKEDK